MVTVGGIASSNVTGTCDWESMGVAVLDLTLMGWGSVFDSMAAPYEVNTMISDVVGGGPDGNATRLLPDGGWTSTGLANLFTGSTNQTQPYSPPRNLPVEGESGGTRGASVGAIVGGVIGGVVLLALTGLLIWAIKTNRFGWLGGTKKQGGRTGAERLELQSTPTTSSKPTAVTHEAPGITPEVNMTPVGELGGLQLIPELEGQWGRTY